MNCNGNCLECFNHLYTCFPAKGTEEHKKLLQEDLEQFLKDEDLIPEYYDLVE